MADTSGSVTVPSPWWRHAAILVMIGGNIYAQPRTRRAAWCLRDVGTGGSRFLLAGHAVRRRLEGNREVHRGGVLGGQRGSRSYDPPGPVSWRSSPNLGFHRPRLLARASPGFPDGWPLPKAGMSAHGGRYDLHPRRCCTHRVGSAAQRTEAGPGSTSVEGRSSLVSDEKTSVSAEPILGAHSAVACVIG